MNQHAAPATQQQPEALWSGGIAPGQGRMVNGLQPFSFHDKEAGSRQGVVCERHVALAQHAAYDLRQLGPAAVVGFDDACRLIFMNRLRLAGRQHKNHEHSNACPESRGAFHFTAAGCGSGARGIWA